MHDDRELAEKRIARELWERLLPLVHADRRSLSVEAGPSPDELAPFAVGSSWGAPWATTWFRLHGDLPDAWCSAVAHRSDRRIEVICDLGFTLDPPGFQAEGLVVADESRQPLHGLHPRRTHHLVARPGDDPAREIDLLVEAASNPTFPQFVPSEQGRVDSAGDEPIFAFRRADAVLVDIEAEALVHDLDVLDGAMRSLALEDPHRHRLRAGIVAALDALPDVERARRRVAVLLPGPDGPTGRHRIVATGHAHIDTAWLWPTRETIRKCARTFSSAVELMDLDPSYRFSCSQAQQYAWIEERHPELFTAIAERVERGQWLPVGGMWVEADMNLPSAESLARQIVFGQRYFESRFGQRCTEVWIPDVFGYPAGLPQLFAAGGMTRFVTQKLSWNKQNRFPHHTFWWEGLDGTRVLTHFPPVDTYNAEITPGDVAHSNRRFLEHGWSSVSLMPFGHGDGGGGPTREMLERARRLASPIAGGVLDASIEMGGPAEVFDEIERAAAAGAEVPIWRGELYFETHRGTLTSQLGTKLGNRRCERLLVEAELWAATVGRHLDLGALWTDVLTQQFHDILPGSSIGWVHDDAEAVFARVRAEVTGIVDELIADLAPPPTPGDDVGWAVVNPADAPVTGVAVVRLDAGVVPPSESVVLADGAVAVAVQAPALAVAPLTAPVVAGRVVSTPTSLTNGHLAVRLTAEGEIESMIDLEAGRDLVPTDRSAAVVELAPDHPVEYDAWDLEAWTRAGGHRVRAVEMHLLDDTPLVGRIRTIRRFGSSELAVTYELRAGERQLRLLVDLDWREPEHLLSMVFPLDVRADRADCDVQLGVVGRPTHPSSPWDAAKFEVCAHRFVSLAEPSFGVAVLNDGRFGHHLFDGGVTLSVARAARYPDPDADIGRLDRLALAIRPHDGDLGDVRAAASLLQQPVRLTPVARPTAEESTAAKSTAPPVVDIRGAGVEVDAVKHADDGSGDLIVRLHEHVGDRRPIVVSTTSPISAAWRCDLLETVQAGIEVGDGTVALTLRPFELVTLRMSVDPSRRSTGG